MPWGRGREGVSVLSFGLHSTELPHILHQAGYGDTRQALGAQGQIRCGLSLLGAHSLFRNRMALCAGV